MRPALCSPAAHAAATSSTCACRAQAVLRMEPFLDARDGSGASALFCACYAGQAGCVAALLAAGAAVALPNTGGESCLYIAALRGHVAVVDCLLAHLTSRGLPWMVSGRLPSLPCCRPSRCSICTCCAADQAWGPTPRPHQLRRVLPANASQ